MTSAEGKAEGKKELRERLAQARKMQRDKYGTSKRIADAFLALPEIKSARVLMLYAGKPGEEVETAGLIEALLAERKRVALPYCTEGAIEAWEIRTLKDLAPGTYGILEPAPALRARSERRVEPASLDVVVIPGVVFDRSGARLGRGKGYYDRFLASPELRALTVGFCFACQLVDEVPREPHDRGVRVVVTESETLRV